MEKHLNNIIWFVLTYDLQSLITAVGSFIITFLALIIFKNKTSKIAKKIELISKLLSIVFAILSILIIVIQMSFSLVPNIYGYEPEYAKIKIHESKLDFTMDNFRGSDGKLVYETIPEINTVVRKNTKITLVFIDKDHELFYTQLKPESNYNYYSGNINIDLLTPLNADSFELIFNDIGVYLHAENPEYSRDLGQYIPKNVHVQLINYETQQVVDEKNSNFSDSVVFNNIPKGTYI